MKMFVFYFTAFFADPSGGTYIPVVNSFVYNTEEDCRFVEKILIGVNEEFNCQFELTPYLENDEESIETALLKDLALKFKKRNVRTQEKSKICVEKTYLSV